MGLAEASVEWPDQVRGICREESPRLRNRQIAQQEPNRDHGRRLIDYAGDGFQDIFFANGAAIPSLRKEDRQ